MIFETNPAPALSSTFEYRDQLTDKDIRYDCVSDISAVRLNPFNEASKLKVEMHDNT